MQPHKLDALLSVPLKLHFSNDHLTEPLAVAAHGPALPGPPELLKLGDLAGGVHLPLLVLLDHVLLGDLLLLLRLLEVPVELLENVRIRIVKLLQALHDVTEGILLKVMNK